jgi:hypothetical protein
MIREFERHVQDFSADAAGRPLEWAKPTRTPEREDERSAAVARDLPSVAKRIHRADE